MFQYLLDRLSERSTWLGILGLIGAFGATVSPEHTQAIATLGTAAAGLVLSATKG